MRLVSWLSTRIRLDLLTPMVGRPALNLWWLFVLLRVLRLFQTGERLAQHVAEKVV